MSAPAAERTKRQAEPMSDDLRDFLLVVRRALLNVTTDLANIESPEMRESIQIMRRAALMVVSHIDRTCR